LSTAIYGLANSLCFQFQIEDLHLKYPIPGQDSKNNISGETVEKDEIEC